MTDDSPDPSTEPWWLVEASDRPSLGQFQRSIYMLNAAERRLKWRHQRNRNSVSRGRLLALLYLAAAGEVTATDLAREGQVNPASVTAMLEQLEDEGIAKKRRDPHDGRVRWISLTPKGRREVGAALTEWTDRLADAFSTIPDADLRVASAVIERLAETLDGVDKLSS